MNNTNLMLGISDTLVKINDKIHYMHLLEDNDSSKTKLQCLLYLCKDMNERYNNNNKGNL